MIIEDGKWDRLYQNNHEYLWSHISKTCLEIGCKEQKTNKRKILSFGVVFDIMKLFKRWGVEELLELLGDDNEVRDHWGLITRGKDEVPRCSNAKFGILHCNVNPKVGTNI